MLQIADRYLFVEVLKAFLAIVFILLMIVSSMLFLRTLEEVNIGALNVDLVLRFLGLQIVRDTSSLLPPAFFLAVLATLSRMARDSELIALGACGIGPGRLYRALFVLAVPVALFTAWFALILQPWAAAGIQEIRLQQSEQVAQIAGLQAGRFYVEEEGDVVAYIGSIDRRKALEHVFILDRRGDKERIVVSDSGTHRSDEGSSDHIITLKGGHRFDGTPGGGDYLIGDFDEYQVRVRSSARQPVQPSKRSMAATVDLIGSAELGDRTEVQHRLSAPLAILTLVAIAVPLVAISPRQKTTGRMLLAFLAYFSFFNLQRLAESWMEAGTTPAWLGSLWYQALILGLVYLLLFPDSLWFRRLRRGLSARRGPSAEAV